MSKSSTVILTGSQGFIGSYVAQELLNNGYKVIGIDNYSKYGKIARSHDNHPNFKLQQVDILKEEFQFKYGVGRFDGADYIIHLAARIGGIKYFHKYSYDLLVQNNAIDRQIFDLAIGTKCKKFIYFSSSMVFESGEAPHCEDDLLEIPPPKSTYGFSKLAGEYYCKGMWEQYGIPFNILRCFNCVGTGEDIAKNEDPNDLDQFGISLSHVIPDFVYKAIKKMDPFPIYGNGQQIRSFTNGKDIGIATRLVMESKYTNTSYNIANNEPISMIELAKKIWQKINGDLSFFNPKFLDPFTYDVKSRSTNINKAKEDLNFEASIKLDQSLDEVIYDMKEKICQSVKNGR